MIWVIKFSFAHTLANDLATEGNESLQIQLFSDVARTRQVGTTSTVTVNDTSTQSANPTAVARGIHQATSSRDILTGTLRFPSAGPYDTYARDTFVWDSLSHSLISGYDIVVNFEQADRIKVNSKAYWGNDANQAGGTGFAIDSLSSANLQRILPADRFGAGISGAQIFQVKGMNGVFLALNDSRAGFQADSDAIIYLKDYIGAPFVY